MNSAHASSVSLGVFFRTQLCGASNSVLGAGPGERAHRPARMRVPRSNTRTSDVNSLFWRRKASKKRTRQEVTEFPEFLRISSLLSRRCPERWLEQLLVAHKEHHSDFFLPYRPNHFGGVVERLVRPFGFTEDEDRVSLSYRDLEVAVSVAGRVSKRAGVSHPR